MVNALYNLVCCPNCGTEHSGNPVYCTSCGKQLSNPTTNGIPSAGATYSGPGRAGAIGATAMKRQSAMRTFARLVIFFLLLIVVIISIPLGLPIYDVAVLFLILLFILVLAIYQSRRIGQLYLNKEENLRGNIQRGEEGINPFGNSPVQLLPGEGLLAHAAPVFRLHPVEEGVAEGKYTENVIIVTNKRLIFLTCLSPQQVQGPISNSQEMWNDSLKRGTIREICQQRIESLKSGGPSDHFPNDFWIDRKVVEEIGYVRKTLNPFKRPYSGWIYFLLSSGRRVRYNVLVVEDKDSLVQSMSDVKKRVI